MGTSCTIGIIENNDLETFRGIYCNYDGYPSNIIPAFAWMFKLNKQNELFEAIKKGTSIRGINGGEEILIKKRGLLDPFKDDFIVKRKDMFQQDYAYVVFPDYRAEMYESVSNKKIFDFAELDWEEIDKHVIRDIMSVEDRFHYGTAFDDPIKEHFNIK